MPREEGGSWECKVQETRGMDHLHYSLKRIGEVASGGVVNLFCHYNSTTSYRQLNHCILMSELTVNIKVCKEDMQYVILSSMMLTWQLISYLHFMLLVINEIHKFSVVKYWPNKKIFVQKNNKTIMSKTHRSTKLCRIKVVDVEQIGPPVFVTSFIWLIIEPIRAFTKKYCQFVPKQQNKHVCWSQSVEYQ